MSCVSRSVANAFSSVMGSLSGTLEFMVIKKLFDGLYELFSGFFELGALVFCFSLIFWVSGLFVGLAVCSVCRKQIATISVLVIRSRRLQICMRLVDAQTAQTAHRGLQCAILDNVCSISVLSLVAAEASQF